MVLYIVDDITIYVLIGLSIAFFVMVGWHLIDTRIRTPESAKILKEAKSKKRDLILAENPSGNAKFYLAQKDGISPSGYILAGNKKRPLLFVLAHLLSLHETSIPIQTATNGGTSTQQDKNKLTTEEKEATMRLFNRKTFLPDVGVVLHVGSVKKAAVSSITALSSLQNSKERFKKGHPLEFFPTKIGAIGLFFSNLYKNDWLQAYGETKFQEGIRVGSKRVGEKYQWLFPLIIILALMAFIAVVMFFIKG